MKTPFSNDRRTAQLADELSCTEKNHNLLPACLLQWSALSRCGIFSDYRQLAYKGRPRVLSTARFWRPLWRALRFFISTYRFLLSVTQTPLVSTSARSYPGRLLVKLIRAQRAA